MYPLKKYWYGVNLKEYTRGSVNPAFWQLRIEAARKFAPICGKVILYSKKKSIDGEITFLAECIH